MITMSNSNAIRYQISIFRYLNQCTLSFGFGNHSLQCTDAECECERVECRVWGQTSRICIIRWFHAHSNGIFLLYSAFWKWHENNQPHFKSPWPNNNYFSFSDRNFKSARRMCICVGLCVSLDQRVTIFRRVWGRKSSFVPGWYLHNSVN